MQENMSGELSQHRGTIVIAMSAIGGIAGWICGEPVGFLVMVVAASVCKGWRAGLFAGVAAMICVGATLHLGSIIAPTPATTVSAVALCAVCLCSIVRLYCPTVSFDRIHALRHDPQDKARFVWEAHHNGRVRSLDPAILTYLGVSTEVISRLAEIDDHAWWSTFVHPDDVEGCLLRWQYSMRTGEPLVGEQRLRGADGTYRWFRDLAVSSREASGEVVAWSGITVDIDDQRKAQVELLKRERQLQALIDTVPALLWCTGPNGDASYINKPLMRWTGLALPDTQAWQDKAIYEAVHPDDRALWKEKLDRSFLTGAPFAHRYRQRRADGVYRWIDGKAEPLYGETGEIIQWYGVCLDVNDEVEAIESMRASERELRLLVDTVPALIWLMTPEGMPYYFNKQFVDWTGTVGTMPLSYEHGQLDVHAELLHPDERVSVALAFEEAVTMGVPLHIKGRLRRHDGEFRWLDSRVEPLHDDKGNIIRWYGVSFDIDDEVRSQQALRESENYLQHVIDTVPIGIILSNAAGKPLYVNKRLEEFQKQVGHAHADRGRSKIGDIRDLIHPEDRDTVQQKVANCLSSGMPFAMRYRQRCHGGEYRWVEGRAEPFRNPDGEIVQWYGVNLDVDDEVKAQEALRQADERLAHASRVTSLAELSVSFAHQLNQPLQAVVSNASALQRWLEVAPLPLERVHDTAAALIRNAANAGDVVAGIRTLFSSDTNQREGVDLNKLIKNVCDMTIDRQYEGHLKLDIDLDLQIPETYADRVQLEQVLINLIRNGIEAMANVAPALRQLRVFSTLTSDRMIVIGVRDWGGGLLEPERIFEPFYTTKMDGMGMGLSICRTIIEAHGGTLTAHNMPPQGAQVSFRLPLRTHSGVPE